MKNNLFSVEYKISNDPMVEVTQQDDATGEAFRQTLNLESRRIFNTSLFFPLDFIPKVSGYGGVITNHVTYDSPFLEDNFLRKRWSFTTFLQANISLPAKINLELGGWYNSGDQEGIMSSEWLYGVSFGVSRKFLDNKAKISFGVEDLFNRFWHAKIDYANMDMDIVSKWDAPVVNMRFSYKFGNQHLKKKKKHNSSASDEMKRTN